MDASSPLPPLGINIGPLADPVFAGVLLSSVLYGITVVQTWNYYELNNDGWILRIFVGTLFILDSVSAVLTIEMGHVYLIQHFGSLATLATLPFSGVLEVAFNVVTVFLVQLFFASRVYLLFARKNLIIPATILVFAVAALVAGMFIVTDINRTRTVAALAKPSMKLEVILTNTFEAVADVLVTAAMSWQFYRRRGNIKTTNSLLDKLLGFVVGRGGLVAATQLLTLGLYVADPTSLNWLPVHFSIGKISHITTVTMLNSRRSLRNPTTHINDTMSSDAPLQLQTLEPMRFEPGTGTSRSAYIKSSTASEYD
ncbi:hypothetical protein B0H19DRAFT_82418 [Mycena capillaripes]|nr:hypothetical protein B0H19DRAFT_82418 [Mycena capillaripes]